MKKEKTAMENKIRVLVDSIADIGDSSAKTHVTRRIEELNKECQSLEQCVHELEEAVSQHVLNDTELDLHCRLLSNFQNSMDFMTVEQKRAAVRTLIKKVVWDGSSAHVILYGAKNNGDECAQSGNQSI